MLDGVLKRIDDDLERSLERLFTSCAIGASRRIRPTLRGEESSGLAGRRICRGSVSMRARGQRRVIPSSSLTSPTASGRGVVLWALRRSAGRSARSLGDARRSSHARGPTPSVT